MRRSIGMVMVGLVLSGCLALSGGMALAEPASELGSVRPIPEGAFARWAAGVRTRIARFSRAPKHVPKTVNAAIVHFVVVGDGSVADAGVSTSSGCAPCDDAALRAVVLAQPFPPIPLEAGRDHVEISVPINFKGARRPHAPRKGHA